MAADDTSATYVGGDPTAPPKIDAPAEPEPASRRRRRSRRDECGAEDLGVRRSIARSEPSPSLTRRVGAS
jgi:hypothetical protein